MNTIDQLCTMVCAYLWYPERGDWAIPDWIAFGELKWYVVLTGEWDAAGDKVAILKPASSQVAEPKNCGTFSQNDHHKVDRIRKRTKTLEREIKR